MSIEISGLNEIHGNRRYLKMSNYVQDPNDSQKQVPGAPPDNYYDRASNPVEGSFKED